MQPIAEWAAKNGVTLRYQTSYGKDMEVAQTALYPDIPETESLYGNDHMDFYRLQAGAVHAMDREIYSMETAAEWTETWNPKGDDGNYGTRGNGVGTYTAAFEMPEGFAEGRAAWLHMGHVRDAYGVRVNGTEVTVDQASGDADVSALVKPGENKIEVTVASSLLNAVLENNKGILNDDGRVLDDRSPSGYGLTEQVTIDGSATRA